MTSFTLKIIALVSMFFDHFGDAFIGHFSFFNLIGRFAFPIFAFQISEGYIHTKNIKKYFFRLGIFALISQIPFSLFSQKIMHSTALSLNVFFTLFIGLLGIYLYDYVIKLFKEKTKNLINNTHNNDNKSNNVDYNDNNNKLISILPYISILLGLVLVILLAYIAEVINTDYGFWGVIVVFMFYLFKNKKVLATISFFILCAIKYLVPFLEGNFNILYVLLALFTFLPIIFINAYNGKQGLKIKYLLYIFYPVHLLLLYFIF